MDEVRDPLVACTARPEVLNLIRCFRKLSFDFPLVCTPLNGLGGCHFPP
jgi:hypothetical protein